MKYCKLYGKLFLNFQKVFVRFKQIFLFFPQNSSKLKVRILNVTELFSPYRNMSRVDWIYGADTQNNFLFQILFLDFVSLNFDNYTRYIFWLSAILNCFKISNSHYFSFTHQFESGTTQKRGQIVCALYSKGGDSFTKTVTTGKISIQNDSDLGYVNDFRYGFCKAISSFIKNFEAKLFF